MAPRISFEDVGLRLPVVDGVARAGQSVERPVSVGGRIQRLGRRAYVQALDEVTLDLRDGDRVALLGHNGSGKTTLLRLMAGVYHPTSGKREVVGSVGTLFAPGLGLSPRASGHENIRFACALYGLDRRQTEAVVADVAEFCELGPFLDLPFGTYSAGMKMRLGFSIVTAVTPDILLIDEVFGAGDRDFYRKARERISYMLESSSILVFASHDASLLRRFCTKGVRLAHGRIEQTGPINEVIGGKRYARVRRRMRHLRPERRGVQHRRASSDVESATGSAVARASVVSVEERS